jgi:hypothetical protein
MSKNKTSNKRTNKKGGKPRTRSQRAKVNKRSAHKTEMVRTFMEILNVVKLYHWKTHSFPDHKNTDELYSQLNENIDKFVEVLLGKTGDRVHLERVKHLPLYDYSKVSDFKRKIEEYKSYLVDLDNKPALNTMSNSDLYTIRDELLADFNQFLYLITFT